MTLQSGTVNQIPWNSQKCLTLYFSNAGIFFQCQSKAILQSGSKYDRSEVQLKFFSHYDIQIIFWIRYLGMHYAAWQYAWSLLYYSIKSWIKVYNTNWQFFYILKFIMLTTEWLAGLWTVKTPLIGIGITYLPKNCRDVSPLSLLCCTLYQAFL